jgi:hypothetical protein
MERAISYAPLGMEAIGTARSHSIASLCLIFPNGPRIPPRYLPRIHPAGEAAAEHYIELYNRTVRYELLARYLFDSIDEVQDFATRWLLDL